MAINSIYIVTVGIGAALGSLIQHLLLNLSGEKLTARLRQQSFAAIIKQEISFFDEEKNGVGFLITRLSSDASLIKGVRLNIEILLAWCIC